MKAEALSRYDDGKRLRELPFRCSRDAPNICRCSSMT
jgi:hypothetical protein